MLLAFAHAHSDDPHDPRNPNRTRRAEWDDGAWVAGGAVGFVLLLLVCYLAWSSCTDWGYDAAPVARRPLCDRCGAVMVATRGGMIECAACVSFAKRVEERRRPACGPGHGEELGGLAMLLSGMQMQGMGPEKKREERGSTSVQVQFGTARDVNVLRQCGGLQWWSSRGDDGAMVVVSPRVTSLRYPPPDPNAKLYITGENIDGTAEVAINAPLTDEAVRQLRTLTLACGFRLGEDAKA